MANKIYQNDVGVQFQVDIGQSVTNASMMKIYVQRPDKSEAVWTAAQYGPTVIAYTSTTGDLAQVGTYLLQGYAEWGATSKHYGAVTSFTVYAKYT